jgi:hypothetical protein
MIDIGRLDAVRRHLRAHPHVHVQSEFACGTSGCVGGWTVALDMDAHVGDDISNLLYPPHCNIGVETRAQKLLGLSDQEAFVLFFWTIGGDLFGVSSEEAALRLVDALINREKGELTNLDRTVLQYYKLFINSSMDYDSEGITND